METGTQTCPLKLQLLNPQLTVNWEENAWIFKQKFPGYDECSSFRLDPYGGREYQQLPGVFKFKHCDRHIFEISEDGSFY